jgi:hypothetical protein
MKERSKTESGDTTPTGFFGGLSKKSQINCLNLLSSRRSARDCQRESQVSFDPLLKFSKVSISRSAWGDDADLIDERWEYQCEEMAI